MTLLLGKLDAINSGHLQFMTEKSSSYKMQGSNMDFSAAVGRSSLPEHHPSGCRTALSRCVPCSSVSTQVLMEPCSFSLFSQPSGTGFLMCEALHQCTKQQAPHCKQRMLGVFLLWKCSKKALKNQTQQ